MLIDSTLYYILLLLQFYSCYLSFSIFYISNLVCSYDMCTYTFPHFIHSLWVFWLLGFAHPGLWLLHSFDQVIWKGSHAWCAAQSFLYVITSILAFFYSCHFLWLLLYWTQYLFYFFIYLLSCLDIYMYCCGDIDSL